MSAYYFIWDNTGIESIEYGLRRYKRNPQQYWYDYIC